MERVYGSAELVLAATRASSSNEGFLQARPCMKTGRVGFNPRDMNASLNLINGESDFEVEPGFIQCDYRIISENAREEKLPLDKRAWAYQERLLATRYLSFRHDEIWFECSQGPRCECGWILARDMVGYYTMNLRNMLECKTKTESATVWGDIVSDYCQRGLTKRSDKLVALSAVASRFQTKFGDTYLAGLWRKDLVQGLLWLTNYFDHNLPLSLSSSEPYYAPTWSWTSVNVKDISFVYRYNLYGSILINIMEAFTIPSTPNRFGPVSGRFIRLQGRPIQSTLHICPPGLLKRIKLLLESSDPEDKGRWIEFPNTTLKLKALYLDLPLTFSSSTLDHTSREAVMSARRLQGGDDSLSQTKSPYQKTEWRTQQTNHG
ncbi:hypothetical protein F5Y02DRAFT_383795 [Annulohypoxylon stygium]|nr:hypothetical protein F5Y02DRAFT_383795 [Annulohypoxylon stygium]